MCVFALQLCGCASSKIDNSLILYDYGEGESDVFNYINRKIIGTIDSQADTNNYVLVNIRRYYSTVDYARHVFFETQYLFIFKRDYLNSMNKQILFDSWHLYKYTNYSEKLYLGRIKDGNYNLILDKINDIIKNKQDTTKNEYQDMEFQMWISSNGIRIVKDILDEHDSFGRTASNSSCTVLFNLMKSMIFEYELHMKYQDLQSIRK
ncbi:MAG: hypothetical protein IPM69_04420 [Ignavibacteria bacterium]|nr:hypothetical protein [Ignavibacteria bacterium]